MYSGRRGPFVVLGLVTGRGPVPVLRTTNSGSAISAARGTSWKKMNRVTQWQGVSPARRVKRRLRRSWRRRTRTLGFVCRVFLRPRWPTPTLSCDSRKGDTPVGGCAHRPIPGACRVPGSARGCKGEVRFAETVGPRARGAPVRASGLYSREAGRGSVCRRDATETDALDERLKRDAKRSDPALPA